ncbi:MAG: LLM class F420-dependent oxidoreductase [Rhodospirillaceae bacterium]|nr:LLM class F420-dependent oxidoreductase [Rhodospirillaceae bacterium]
MRISIFAPVISPLNDGAYLKALSIGAEERGFHGIWLGEHVVLFDKYDAEYPYAEDGRIPVGGENGLLEPITGLAFMAACTERIRLGTGVCLVSQRNPVYTAKEIAAVDYLSNGRVDFGVGVGWLEEEFTALGVPFERRGTRCREYLDVIASLWRDDVSSFKGEFYDLPPCRQYPKPVQQPGPPIYFGGESMPALRRTADLGQGWYGFNTSVEQTRGCLDQLDELLEKRGRKRDDLDIVIGPYRHKLTKDTAKEYEDAGVDTLVVMIVGRDLDEMNRWLDRFAEDYVV